MRDIGNISNTYCAQEAPVNETRPDGVSGRILGILSTDTTHALPRFRVKLEDCGKQLLTAYLAQVIASPHRPQPAYLAFMTRLIADLTICHPEEMLIH